MLENIILAFIPMFVAVDAIGLLPVYISLTEGMGEQEKDRVISLSTITAFCFAVGFLFLGKGLFSVLNIYVGDFMVAGGILLFCIALLDIVNPFKRRLRVGSDLGIVPLGTPLLAGPAVLTTTLIIADLYGFVAVFISIFTNILLAGLMMKFSKAMMKVIGAAGARALSKIAAILLAAIAVMMVRKGIFLLIGYYRY